MHHLPKKPGCSSPGLYIHPAPAPYSPLLLVIKGTGQAEGVAFQLVLEVKEGEEEEEEGWRRRGGTTHLRRCCGWGQSLAPLWTSTAKSVLEDGRAAAAAAKTSTSQSRAPKTSKHT